VTSVEIDPELSAAAAPKLARAKVPPVELRVGDGARGFGAGHYDAIVLTGSTPVLPEAFARQLAPGGRLFAVVGDAPAMTARMVRWAAPGAATSHDLFETVIAPLKNAATPSRFRF
jgi:protein-L-isoaspartate(D-aspartate) O-methyltransferase